MFIRRCQLADIRKSLRLFIHMFYLICDDACEISSMTKPSTAWTLLYTSMPKNATLCKCMKRFAKYTKVKKEGNIMQFM